MALERNPFRLVHHKRGTQRKDGKGNLVYTDFALKKKTDAKFLFWHKYEASRFVLRVYQPTKEHKTGYQLDVYWPQFGGLQSTSDGQNAHNYDNNKRHTARTVARRHVKKIYDGYPLPTIHVTQKEPAKS